MQSHNQEKPPNLLQVIGSVLASFFGVQNAENRKRDFTRGKASQFIIVGIVMTLAFVLSLWLLVKLVLRQAGV